MTWQLLTAISVFSLSISVLLQRVLLHKDKTDPYAYAVVFQTIVGILLTVVAVIHGLTLNGIMPVLLPAIVAMIAFGVGHILYAKTLQHVEASVFSVLFSTQAIWIMLFGIVLFHESLTILQIIGSVLILSSVVLLTQNVRSLSLDKGMLLGLATGLIFGIAITCWSYVGRYVDGPSWAAVSFLGTALVSYAVWPKSIYKMPPLLKGKTLSRLLLLGVFYGIGSITMLFAYQQGPFSIVTPLRQTGIIVTVLLALLILSKERTRIWAKLLAAFVCFCGVVLLVI